MVLILRISECSGVPGTRKPISLHLDDRSEVVCFCRTFAPLRAVLLVSTCFVLWAERFTCRPRLEIDMRRRPRNPQTRLSQCFPSVLMCSETTVIFVCKKRVPKACREAFVTIKTSLGRSTCFRVPFICSWIGHPGSIVRKASANVQECPGLSRRLLKCTRSLSSCDQGYRWCSLLESVGQNGLLTACPSLVECPDRGCSQRL
ncbi:hypothetical protein CRG98_000659 [Punica granatum]|uniref:Uncharacterized protein n=1 Tax=Punica granatum TaxID=22663 RepID=A0A2I0LE46_PUNGR|nr:hypothetical protein CRG98_000659 [Punica granatum]